MSQNIKDVNGIMCRPIIAIERALTKRFCDDDENAIEWMMKNKQYYNTWKNHVNIVSSVFSFEMHRWKKFEKNLTING